MKLNKLLAFALPVAFTLGGLSGAAQASGYWKGSTGEQWFGTNGKCWKGVEWVVQDATVECDGDDDGDGVPNPLDKCPNTRAGAEVDADGCEIIKDSDGDGVYDDKDKCPGTLPGVKVDIVGCAIPEHVDLHGIHFAFDSDVLTSDAKLILNDIAAAMRAHPNAKVEVQGHTDSTGPAEYNQLLSKRRALSAMDYLVSQGASAGNLSAIGMGEDHPIADNGTEEGRSKNRRVEFVQTAK